MNQHTEDMHLYFTRVRPMCRELFAMAFVICGDYDAAEYALQRVILDGWHGRRRFRSTRGFRESLRADMRRVALSGAKDAGDGWDQFGSDPIDGAAGEPVLAAMQQESAVIRRAVMLKYGCLMKNGQIARAMDVSGAQVQQILDKFQRRIKRKLTPEQRGRLDQRLRELCRMQLESGGAAMPDIGALYHNFEAEASADYSPVTRFASRAAVYVVSLIMLVAMCCVMWGISAIIRPAQLDEPGLITETLDKQ